MRLIRTVAPSIHLSVLVPITYLHPYVYTITHICKSETLHSLKTQRFNSDYHMYVHAQEYIFLSKCRCASCDTTVVRRKQGKILFVISAN